MCDELALRDGDLVRLVQAATEECWLPGDELRKVVSALARHVVGRGTRVEGLERRLRGGCSG